MQTQNLLRLILLLMLMLRIMLATVWYRFGSWRLVLKLNFCLDFEVDASSRFCDMNSTLGSVVQCWQCFNMILLIWGSVFCTGLRWWGLVLIDEWLCPAIAKSLPLLDNVYKAIKERIEHQWQLVLKLSITITIICMFGIRLQKNRHYIFCKKKT